MNSMNPVASLAMVALNTAGCRIHYYAARCRTHLLILPNRSLTAQNCSVRLERSALTPKTCGAKRSYLLYARIHIDFRNGGMGVDGARQIEGSAFQFH